MTVDPLAPLRARFAARAAEEAVALRSYLAGDVDAAEAERIIHGLAGAAGLFGFAHVSEQARDIDALFALGKSPERAAIERLIGDLKALARDHS